MNNVYVHRKKNHLNKAIVSYLRFQKKMLFLSNFFFFFLFLLRSNLLVSQANGYETNQCNPLEWKARQVLHKELVREKRAKYYVNSENTDKKCRQICVIFRENVFLPNLHERSTRLIQDLFRFQFRFPSLDTRPFLPNFAANRWYSLRRKNLVWFHAMLTIHVCKMYF